MADETKVNEKKNSLLGQIIPPVIIALLVGGTSPWWFKAIHKEPEPAPAPVVNSNQVSKPVVNQEEATVSVTKEFIVGRWRVNQTNAAGSGETTVDYYENGRFDEHALMVSGYQGQNVTGSGNWQLEILSPQSFRLGLIFDSGYQWAGKFKIIDKDRVQNIDENYIAERVK